MEDIVNTDTLDDFYLTYSTIMIDLIDKNTHDRMMKRVINDIIENKNSIIKRIQKKDYETKKLLGIPLYEWIENEKYFFQKGSLKIHFYERFCEAFSKDIYDECKYRMKVKGFHHRTSIKGKKITISIYEHRFFSANQSVLTKALLKYHKKRKILKLSYIETPYSKNKKYEVELFKDINDIYLKIQDNNKKLKFAINNKYNDIYLESINRGYFKEINNE